jgi:hypothetical protein
VSRRHLGCDRPAGLGQRSGEGRHDCEASSTSAWIAARRSSAVWSDASSSPPVRGTRSRRHRWPRICAANSSGP